MKYLSPFVLSCSYRKKINGILSCTLQTLEFYLQDSKKNKVSLATAIRYGEVWPKFPVEFKILEWQQASW